MKRVWYIFLLGILFLVAYSIWLAIFPLKKTVFYTNEERTEEYIYSKETYPIVLVGSSLSGALENEKLFDEPYFNLYLPFTDCCTGVELIRRCKKVPQKLFIEINHIDRGIDSTFIQNTFEEPFYSLKSWFPIFLKKNKIIPNTVDRVRKPVNRTINAERPPINLYTTLLADAHRDWGSLPDTIRFNKIFEHLESSLKELMAQGCHVYFYEVPMDSSLNHAPLLMYQKQKVLRFAQANGCRLIPPDTSFTYSTGDGVHLLKNDAHVFCQYFINEVKMSK